MGENNTIKKQLSQGAEEILQQLRQIEVSVTQDIERLGGHLLQIRHYEKFTINSRQGPLDLSNVNIVIQQDKDGNISYHFMWIDKKTQKVHENIVVRDGKVHTIPEAEDFLGNIEIYTEGLIRENEQNEGRLKGISKRATSKQVIEMMDSNEKKEEESENQKIQEDLSEQQGTEIKIGKHRPIKDEKIADRMPKVFKKGIQYEIVQLEPTGKAAIMEKVNGKYQINDKVQLGQPSVKEVFSIGADGHYAPTKMTDQTMKIKGEPDKRIVLSINEWGEQDIQTVDVTPCNRKIGRAVRMENESENEQEDKNVTDGFERNGERYIADDIAHKIERLKELGVTEIHVEELEDLDIELELENGAKAAGITKENFIKDVKIAEGKTLTDRIKDAVLINDERYRGSRLGTFKREM